MRRYIGVLAVLSLVAISLSGCNAIKGLFNPFVGNWKSGIFEIEFRSDKTFKLVIGRTVSVNLDGNYKYDDNTLDLNFDSGSGVKFSYEFMDNKNKLILIPQTDFDYIKTKLEFTRE